MNVHGQPSGRVPQQLISAAVVVHLVALAGADDQNSSQYTFLEMPPPPPPPPVRVQELAVGIVLLVGSAVALALTAVVAYPVVKGLMSRSAPEGKDSQLGEN